MSHVPVVSVVVPAHGYPAGVERLLGALCLQEDAPAFEVVIVDDGSPEPLEPKILAYAGRLEVRCIRLANGGPARARNIGAAAARAGWVVFTDHDCVPFPDWLREMVRGLERWRGAMLGGSTVGGLPDNPWSTAHETLCHFLREWTSPNCQPFFTTNNLGVRRDQLLELGGFNPQFSFASEDRDLARRWMRAGFPLNAVPGARVQHCHPFSAYSFCRHHIRYGRGAADYHRVSERSGPGWPVGEMLSFHAGLVRLPWRCNSGGIRGVWRAARTSALLLLSQAIYAAAYYGARLATSPAARPGLS